MKLFSLAAVTIYCAVSLLMAIRLLLLARRSRELPELMIGLSFLMGGMLGYSFSVASSVLLGASRADAANVTYIIGQTGMALAAFFTLFSWRLIFAPAMPGGRALVVVWGMVLFVAHVGVLMTTGPVLGERVMTGPYWVQLIAQGGCYAIIAWASHAHARKLERRCAIGLGDPVVANRLMLWGLANTAITFSYLYSITASLMILNGLPSIFDPSVIAACGLTAACCVTLGFLPPRAYTEWIRAKSAMAAS